MPRDLTTNQKYRFEVSSSLLSNNKSFLNWILMCDEKWILLDNWRWPVQWLDWKEAPKHFPKPNLHQKKGHCRCLHHSFVNPSETITSEKSAQQIDEMHPKLQRPQPALVNRKGSVFLHDNTWPHVTQPTLQRLNEVGWKLCPIRHLSLTSRQPTTTSLSISTAFQRESASTGSGMQKTRSKRSLNPEAWAFMLQE